ncbi:hypothetical protein DYB25_006255 [Aphanomyces astaci]|uniref:Uncharacterized protein n=1 Tax=Aphanomyces astaci TaxID=112090 RepID=A0A397AXH8_APHAT|nr:hypothetical protein DYB25_006255 [Aphanomyces astaci]
MDRWEMNWEAYVIGTLDDNGNVNQNDELVSALDDDVSNDMFTGSSSCLYETETQAAIVNDIQTGFPTPPCSTSNRIFDCFEPREPRRATHCSAAPTTTKYAVGVHRSTNAMEHAVGASALSFETHSILYAFMFATYHHCVEVLASVVKAHGLGLIEESRDVYKDIHWRTRFQCAFQASASNPQLHFSAISCPCPWTIEITKAGLNWYIQPPAANTKHNHNVWTRPFARPPAQAYATTPRDLWVCDPFAEFLTAQWSLDQGIQMVAFTERGRRDDLSDDDDDVDGTSEKDIKLNLSDSHTSCLHKALAVFPIQETFPAGPFPSIFDAELTFYHWNRNRGFKTVRARSPTLEAGPVKIATFQCAIAQWTACPWFVQLAKCPTLKKYHVTSMYLVHNHCPKDVSSNTSASLS